MCTVHFDPIINLVGSGLKCCKGLKYGHHKLFSTSKFKMAVNKV